MSRGLVFSGSPRSASLAWPFVAPKQLLRTGPSLGVELGNRRDWHFDPQALKASGQIKSTTFAVLGDVGSGKSTLLKVATRLLGLQAHDSDDDLPVPSRLLIHNRKYEGNAPEYAPVIDSLAGETISLRNASINLFDPSMGLNELHLHEIAINLCETAKGTPLTRWEPLVIQVGIFRMLRDISAIASLEALEVVLRGLKHQDLRDFYIRRDSTLQHLFTAALREDPDLNAQLQLIITATSNVPPEEFEHDAGLVHSYLVRMLSGEFGELFKAQTKFGLDDTRTLHDLLSHHTLMIDWVGVNDKAKGVLAAMMWYYQNVALANGDLSIIPHIDIGDEEHEAFNILMYVRFMSAFIKKARSFHTTIFRATQYESDFVAGGDEGSSISKLAKGIVQGFGATFYGRLPNREEIRVSLRLQGISDLDCERIFRLPQGCFGFKVPDQDIVFVQILPTESEMALIQTNEANDRMMNRVPIMVQKALLESRHKLYQRALAPARNGDSH